MDCDTSSAASEVMSPKTSKLTAAGPQLKMSLPLKQRLRVVDISSQEDSSSTDSTPQRRLKLNTNSHSDQRLLLPTSATVVSKPILQKQPQQGIVSMATQHPKLHHHHHKSGITCSSTSTSKTGKQIKGPPAPILSRKMKPQSRFFLNLSGESESCSSAMSSMESVRSSNSGGSVQSLVSSSESGAGCSMSSNSNSNLSIPVMAACPNKPTLELRTHRSNILSSSKFQVLSPISDKSQEQSSEQGDGSSSRTPKVSPTDHILTSCCGVSNTITDDNENNNPPSCSTENNVDPAPFSMPKLQRRLAQQQSHQKSQSSSSQDSAAAKTTPSSKYYQNSLLKRANSGIQGSDSGISMSSQDVQDMVELLKLPFDMPKLRRKTQHILSRPQSMPSSSDQHKIPLKLNDYQNNETTSSDLRSSASDLPIPHDALTQIPWPGPKPSETGSTMSNFQYHHQSHSSHDDNWQFNENISGNAEQQTITTTNSVGVEHQILAPNIGPPPGFSDENNQFYLEETTETTSSAEDMEAAAPCFIKGKERIRLLAIQMSTSLPCKKPRFGGRKLSSKLQRDSLKMEFWTSECRFEY